MSKEESELLGWCLEALQDIARRPSLSDCAEENLAALAREVELQNHWLEKISVSLEAIAASMERVETKGIPEWHG